MTLTDEFYIVQFYKNGERIHGFTCEAPTEDAIKEFLVERIGAHILKNEPMQIPVYHRKEGDEWFVFSEEIYYQMGYIDQAKIFKGNLSDLEEIASLEWEEE